MKTTEKDIGRRVVVNGEIKGCKLLNEPGKIVGIDKMEDNYIAVEFDRPKIYRFHSCNGMAQPSRGFWIREDMITFTDEENKIDMDFQVGDEVE